MAEITTLTRIEVSISPTEFISSCNDQEVDEIIDILEKNNEIISLTKPLSYQNVLWNTSISKLLKNRHQLSKDDEKTILEIANKL